MIVLSTISCDVCGDILLGLRCGLIERQPWLVQRNVCCALFGRKIVCYVRAGAH